MMLVGLFSIAAVVAGACAWKAHVKHEAERKAEDERRAQEAAARAYLKALFDEEAKAKRSRTSAEVVVIHRVERPVLRVVR